MSRRWPAGWRAALGLGVVGVVGLVALLGLGSAQSEPSTVSRPSVTAEPDGGSADPDEGPLLRVAWLNQGQRESEPWTAAHGRAVDLVADRYGDEVEISFIESVQLGPPTDELIDDLVDDGVDLVFATSYGFSPHLSSAAQRHPEVRFEQARGLEVRDNLATYSGADEEPIYLAGRASAHVTSSKRLGFVATVPEPETIRHLNAYTLGARSVDPSITVEVAWVGSWWDPVQERALAEQLIDRGADVVATGAISPATGQVAQTEGVGWVSHDVDRSAEFGDVWVSAAVPQWGSYYVRRVGEAIDGRWVGELYYGSMADGFTDVARLGRRVPPEGRSDVAEAREGIKAGVLDVFAGPIVDRSGRLRVPPGERLSLDERLGMLWLVEGVVGEVPAS